MASSLTGDEHIIVLDTPPNTDACFVFGMLQAWHSSPFPCHLTMDQQGHARARGQGTHPHVPLHAVQVRHVARSDCADVLTSMPLFLCLAASRLQ